MRIIEIGDKPGTLWVDDTFNLIAQLEDGLKAVVQTVARENVQLKADQGNRFVNSDFAGIQNRQTLKNAGLTKEVGKKPVDVIFEDAVVIAGVSPVTMIIKRCRPR